MKNIQVIDGADNAVYDVFAATDDEFAMIFPAGHDVAFIDEVMDRAPRTELDVVSQDVVPVKAESGDGRFVSDGGVRTAEVVVLHPRLQLSCTRV